MLNQRMRDRLLECFRNHRSSLISPQKKSQSSDTTSLGHALTELIDASVLIPIIDHTNGLTVLFTERSKELKNHPGQISFPGGRMEASDEDYVATALRESEEEIGLSRRAVTILGQLDICLTGTGFRITPVVGLIKEPLSLRLSPREVADTFEVPLLTLLDKKRYRTNTTVLENGDTREFHVFDYPDRYIWGATAKMLVNLRNVIGN